MLAIEPKFKGFDYDLWSLSAKLNMLKIII